MSAPLNYLKLTQFRYDDSTPVEAFDIQIKHLQDQQHYSYTQTREKVIEHLKGLKNRQEFKLKRGFFSEDAFKREVRISELEEAQYSQGFCELRMKKIEIYKSKHEEAIQEAYQAEKRRREAKKNTQKFIQYQSEKDDKFKKTGIISRIRMKFDSMLK